MSSVSPRDPLEAPTHFVGTQASPGQGRVGNTGVPLAVSCLPLHSRWAQDRLEARQVAALEGPLSSDLREPP